MKSSLANTFYDRQMNDHSVTKDRVKPHLKPLIQLLKNGSDELLSDEVYVIKPFVKDFSSGAQSSLMVNERLKKRYDSILEQLSELKIDLLRDVGGLSGIKIANNAEKYILEDFGKNNFFELMLSLENDVNNANIFFADFKYNKILKHEHVTVMNKNNVSTSLETYIEKYERVIEEAGILDKNFDVFSAKSVSDTLDKYDFYGANHKINILDKAAGEYTEFSAKGDFSKELDALNSKVVNSPELKTAWDNVDKAFKTIKAQEIRKYLLGNKELLPYLRDFENLRKKFWLSYFLKRFDKYNALLAVYKTKTSELESIYKSARAEKTRWQDVVSVFNSRYSMPFTMRVENLPDIILREVSTPRLVFDHTDINGEIVENVKADIVKSCLSRGEERAFYILNILFDLEHIIKSNKITIVVVDDIADSFDYKNKYAVMHYLREISQLPRIRLLILTHNFDFFRTIIRRINLSRNYALKAERKSKEIKIEPMFFQNNPFIYWIERVATVSQAIALIPFVRNIVEYTKGSTHESYSTLTSLLHIKDKTFELKLKHLFHLFQDEIPRFQNTVELDVERGVISCLFEDANRISDNSVDEVSLEEKLVLIISCRLLAELIMMELIVEKESFKKLKSDQTIMLYKILVGEDSVKGKKHLLDLLDRVNLMTPENIHVNSFMFEPILDVGSSYLIKLYKDLSLESKKLKVLVKNLNTSKF